MAQLDYTKRTGKYRHIYGDLHKPDKQFLEIPNPLTSGEGSYVGASGKFFAFASGNVQKLYVRSLDNPGRLGKGASCIALNCIKGKVWDFDFSPFIDNMIALGDDNGKVAVAQVPLEGLSSNVSEELVDLGAVHGKKVALVEFHPTASSILATGSFDRTVKITNIETGTRVAEYNGLGDNIYSMKWNNDGSQIAVLGKDKQLRIFDPRNIDSSIETIQAFEGAKSSKVFWVSRLNWIGATGFSKQAKRQLKFWDLRDLTKPIYQNTIDQASSVLMPHWDDDNGVLYLPGKGEGTVQFGEIINDNKKYYALGAYRNPEPQKGGGWVPKRGLNVWKCEVQRFLKLTNKDVKPISFIVPRKAGADVFQEDIYPDCVSTRAAMTSDEWMNGSNKNASRMSMDPSKRSNEDIATTTFVKKKTYSELEAENEQLKQRVRELEAQLGIPSTIDTEEKEDAGATMSSAVASASNDAAVPPPEPTQETTNDTGATDATENTEAGGDAATTYDAPADENTAEDDAGAE